METATANDMISAPVWPQLDEDIRPSTFTPAARNRIETVPFPVSLPPPDGESTAD